MSEHKEALIGAMAKLEGSRQRIRDARAQLVRRAQQQADSMQPPIDHVGQHVEANRGGGLLAQRRLRTLHVERGRLLRFLGKHEAILDG